MIVSLAGIAVLSAAVAAITYPNWLWPTLGFAFVALFVYAWTRSGGGKLE